MKTKLCMKCGKRKALSKMVASTGSKDGYENRCKECKCKYRREWEKKPRNVAWVACEICMTPTRAEGGMCTPCARESLLMFGDRINKYNEGQLERTERERKRVGDSFKCVCTDIQTRLRMKRLSAKMDTPTASESQMSLSGAGRKSQGTGTR